jgi:hypothetical protein
MFLLQIVADVLWTHGTLRAVCFLFFLGVDLFGSLSFRYAHLTRYHVEFC